MVTHLIVQHDSYHAAFCRDEGELLETVDFHEDGTPDFAQAGPCDLMRGDNPKLQAHLDGALRALTGE